MELPLGAQRSEVRQRLGSWRSFRRTPDAPEADQFADAGLMIEFDPQDRATSIELTEPAVAVYRGVSLLGRQLAAAQQALAEAGSVVDPDADGAVIDSGAVRLFVVDGVIESVYVGP